MHKNTWLLFVSAFALNLSLISCLDVEDNRRIQVLGSLVDDSGNPISGLTVQSSGDYNLLGYDISDKNGQFSFTSLESNADDFSIEINRQGHDTLFALITYINGSISTPSPVDLRDGKRPQSLYDLGKINLHEIAFFDLNLKRTSASNQDALRYTIHLPENYCTINFSKSKIDTTGSPCFETITRSGVIAPGETEKKYGFKTLKNTNAILEYNLDSGETQHLTIPITKYKSSYDFEF